MNTSARGYRNERGMNSGGPDGIILHCLLYFPHYKHPFNCSDTALRVAKAIMIGAKVNFFCSAILALFLEFRARNRPQDLWPSVHLGNRA